jgi:hypothetical protein
MANGLYCALTPEDLARGHKHGRLTHDGASRASA